MRIFILSILLATRSLVGQLPETDPLRLVNTPSDEQNPVMSPDGKTLFFTIGNHPGNMGGSRDPGDIWLSRWTGNQWSAPVHGGKLINDRAYNGVANLSTDGNRLFLLSHYDPSGNMARTQGLSVSINSGNGWSRPENISIPYFQNKSIHNGGHVAPNDVVFIFSAETYGSFGVEDLYVTVRQGDGKWSEPRNLGAKMNTKFQELCPSLSVDGRTIYFSSNGRKGFGSFDIYTSTRLDDSWLNWSEPVNMGPSINTEGRELYYKEIDIDGNAFYTSTLNSDGYGDIKMYRNKATSDENAVASVDSSSSITLRVTKVGSTNDIGVKVFGKVTNVKTGEPVMATLIFSGTSNNNISTAQSTASGYSVVIPSAQNGFMTISASGFISKIQRLDATIAGEAKLLEMDVQLQPVEEGVLVSLNSVLFEQSTTNLLPESFPELDLVAAFLKENSDVQIELAGHTDNKGIYSHNVKLSADRVQRVIEYLLSKGIDPKRITGKGYGSTRPIASNDTEETRRLNRRVEFKVTKF